MFEEMVLVTDYSGLVHGVQPDMFEEIAGDFVDRVHSGEDEMSIAGRSFEVKAYHCDTDVSGHQMTLHRCADRTINASEGRMLQLRHVSVCEEVEQTIRSVPNDTYLQSRSPHTVAAVSAYRNE